MATTTRTDTSYSATLLRLHALEEYVKAELAAIKAAIEDLEPGGGGGDLDRIFSMTVDGAQSPASADPQAPSIYDDMSMHRAIWGDSTEIKSLMVGTRPLINFLADPDFALIRPTFFTTQTMLNATFGDLYEYIIPTDTAGYSLAELTYGTNISAINKLIVDGRSFYDIAIGTGTNSLLDDGDSLYSRIKAIETRLSAAGIP